MTINTNQLLFILEKTPAEQNVMLVGKHGIGKSRILEDFYKEKALPVITLFLGQMSDPGDLIGLPEKNPETGKTDFMLPYWFPTEDKPVVLFLDELNRARPEVLQTIMDLTLNRKLAGKSLPKGSRIISAVNGGNEYQLTDLDPALVSRFNIYEFFPTVEEWLDWARKTGIDERITGFIENSPDMLDGESESNYTGSLERTPDRRSWERASNIIKGEELNDKFKVLLTGVIGQRATSLFFRYLEENDLPSPKTILHGEFSLVSQKLEKLSEPELSSLNTAIFSFLQNSKIPEDENYSKNLELYFDWLKANSLSEITAHFCSQMESSSFPKALIFISTKCPSLYSKVMEAISEM